MRKKGIKRIAFSAIYKLHCLDCARKVTLTMHSDFKINFIEYRFIYNICVGRYATK